MRTGSPSFRLLKASCILFGEQFFSHGGSPASGVLCSAEHLSIIAENRAG